MCPAMDSSQWDSKNLKSSDHRLHQHIYIFTQIVPFRSRCGTPLLTETLLPAFLHLWWWGEGFFVLCSHNLCPTDNINFLLLHTSVILPLKLLEQAIKLKFNRH
jgi:hypothetical protein